jgi:HAD superfamily hydrolase (TIGR01509 family)
MLKALLFDLDGTIANTDPIHFQTWQDVLRPYGLEFDRPFYDDNFSGRLNQAIIQDLLPQLSSSENDELAAFKEAQFRQRAKALNPTPGLLDLLNWTEKQALKRAVVTNAPRENVQFMLETLGLEATFPIVILAEELPVGKPDPLPYQASLSRLGVLAGEAIAFEDSPSGIRSAVAAGIATVGIASTQRPEELYGLGATWVVDDFSDARLWAWLEELRHPPAIAQVH